MKNNIELNNIEICKTSDISVDVLLKPQEHLQVNIMQDGQCEYYFVVENNTITLMEWGSNEILHHIELPK